MGLSDSFSEERSWTAKRLSSISLGVVTWVACIIVLGLFSRNCWTWRANLNRQLIKKIYAWCAQFPLTLHKRSVVKLSLHRWGEQISVSCQSLEIKLGLVGISTENCPWFEDSRPRADYPSTTDSRFGHACANCLHNIAMGNTHAVAHSLLVISFKRVCRLFICFLTFLNVETFISLFC